MLSASPNNPTSESKNPVNARNGDRKASLDDQPTAASSNHSVSDPHATSATLQYRQFRTRYFRFCSHIPLTGRG